MNKSRLFWLLTLIVHYSTLLAQAPQCHWVTRLTGTNLQGFSALQINNKGEIYAAGMGSENTQIESCCDTSSSTYYPSTRSMLVKLSASGAPIWQKEFNQSYGVNFIRKILIDKNENIYAVGNYDGFVDFNLDTTATSLLIPNLADIFIAKYDKFGNYIWVRGFGGNTPGDFSCLIDFASDSNIVMSGYFADTVDFGNPDSPIIFNSNGVSDLFTVKINALDGSTIWAKQFSGIGYENIHAQTIDSIGNIYLVGDYTEALDVDPGPGAQLTNPTGGSLFLSYILKLDNQGDFVWVKQNEGSIESTLGDIQIGPDNSFYTFGVYYPGCDFDFSPDNVVPLPDATAGVFLTKYDLDGNFIWVRKISTAIWGGGSLQGEYLETGNSGNVYVSAYIYGATGSNDFDPGIGQSIITPPSSAAFNPYIVCFNPLGDFEWVKTIRNPDFAWIFGLAVDSLEKNFYSRGEFSNVSEFEPGNNQFTYDGGYYNGYIAKYSFCDRIINEAYVETCEPFYEIAGQILDSSGFYSINYRSIEGCDSITCLTLNLKEAISQLSFQSCNAVEVNGQIYESSGTYQQIFDNGTGCDSVLVIQVAISSPSTSTLNIDECDPISINGFTYSTSGQFTQLLQNASGCDSILTINTQILNLNAQIFQTDSMLYVNGTPTSVQWINCTTGQAIPGATQTSFVPQISGNFGAVITIGECADTSNCRQIIKGTAAEKPGSLCDNLIVTPNPVNEQIEFTLDKSSYDIRLFTSTGALVISTKGNAQKQIINFRELAPAMYVLQVDECRYKIVKQ